MFLCVYTHVISRLTALGHNFHLDGLGRKWLTSPLGRTPRPLGTSIAVWHGRQTALKPRHALDLSERRHWDIERPEGHCMDFAHD